MAIYRLDNPKKIQYLYDQWNETMIWSYLQGCMGEAFVDHLEKPRSSQIVIADFCFFAGIVNKELIKNIHKDFLILVPQDDKWSLAIEEVYGKQVRIYKRYALLKEPHVFNRQHLENIVNQLSSPYKIQKINKQYYEKILSKQWSKDLCKHFKNYQDYQLHGLGYVVLYENEIVAGASSYTYYQNGIEIEIDTRKDHRRRGLAKSCGAKLILECLKNNKYPSWDAQNEKSLSLAYQLGYHLDKSYEVYEFTQE